MTEQRDQPGPDEWEEGSGQVASATAAPEPQPTGLPHVDEVMRAVGMLEERPLEEHIGVFEAAQAQLRQALDTETDPA